MNKLEQEYIDVLNSLAMEEASLDYSLAEKHIADMTRLSKQLNSAITIFDNYRRTHLFSSPNHRELFGYSLESIHEEDSLYFDLQIHPDDFEQVMRNGIACWKYFFIGNRNSSNHKLIREYRVNANGTYRRVTEQIQVLETDNRGNVWLSLCVMDLSPNQSPPYNVSSKLINVKTGDVITPINALYGGKPILSDREISILKLINDGKLSKEIADLLSISVHTVNTHRQRILQKLEVDTSIEAIKYAVALGLLDGSEPFIH